MQSPVHFHPVGLFPARIQRRTFLWRGMLLLSAGFSASLLLSAAHHAGLFVRLVCIGAGVTMLLCLFVLMFRSWLMPRLRDIGVHPAWSLLIFVHVLSGFFLLALLLIPTDALARRRYIL